MVVGTRIENPIVQALPPGPGTLSIIEKNYEGGNQTISSTTPVEITGTRQVFALAGTQDVMFTGFASAGPSADRIANVGFGINIDGIDYYGNWTYTPNVGELVHAALCVSKGLSLGPGNHTVYLTAYRVSGTYNPGYIVSDAQRPSRWEAIFGGGTDTPNKPVVGGSGTQYLTIADAIAGETETRVAGVVPQAGTVPGVIVGPGTLSAVNDFYKDWFVVNTDTTPTNGLVAQWARVSSYDGATRTLTIDKPWDFSTESDFLLVDPVRLTLKQDVTEDVTVNKACVMDLGGNRVKGKIDVTASEFCWIRGANAFVTNGIQKSDFGLLKLDKITVSRRDATIYAVLMTNGSDLGRCELRDCEFMGRVAGRRGYSGWYIQNCKNYGVPATLYDVPYALVESIAGVAITLSALDVGLDTQFGGSMVYSENSIIGATAYISILGSLRSNPDFVGTKQTTKKLSFFTVTGAATMTITATSGGVIISPGDLDANADSPITGLVQQWSILDAIDYTGACSVTLSTGGGFRATFATASNGSVVFVGGTATMSGSITLAGSDGIVVAAIAGGSFLATRLFVPMTGSLTVSGTGVITQTGGGCAVIQFLASQTSGTPTFTFSKTYQVQASAATMLRTYIFTGAISVTVGTWAISGNLLSAGFIFVLTPIALSAVVAGGTWTVSGTFSFFGATIGDGTIIFTDHLGTAGTITVSGAVYYVSNTALFSTIAKATGAGATTVVSSATFIQRGGTVGTGSLVQAVTATSTATLSGDIRFHNCTIVAALVIATSTTAGSVITGPTPVLFDHCTFASTLATESGTGTFTWTGATLTFRHCHVEGLFTIVLTRFTTVQAYHTRFNGNSSNKGITATGTRPTTYRYWKCSFASRFDDIQPEVLDVYDILPAQAALVQGQPVKVNGANQYQVCVAASIVDGVALAAAGGAGTILIAVRQGRIYVTCKAGTVNGDNLVLDLATPTQANQGAFLAGQEIGTALENVGAVVAGKCYTALNVR